MLRAELGKRFPAGIEEHKDRPDVMPRGNGEKCIDALLESLRILLPEKVVQEDTHGIHADALSPAKLAVDRGRVEGIGLPHLEFVDRGGRKKIRAHRPGLRFVPGVGLLLCPVLLRSPCLLCLGLLSVERRQNGE